MLPGPAGAEPALPSRVRLVISGVLPRARAGRPACPRIHDGRSHGACSPRAAQKQKRYFTIMSAGQFSVVAPIMSEIVGPGLSFPAAAGLRPPLSWYWSAPRSAPMTLRAKTPRHDGREPEGSGRGTGPPEGSGTPRKGRASRETGQTTRGSGKGVGAARRSKVSAATRIGDLAQGTLIARRYRWFAAAPLQAGTQCLPDGERPGRWHTDDMDG
jgi:hypothetical protein